MSTLTNGIPRDYFVETGFGNIDGHRRVTALGNVAGLQTTTSVAAPADVWTGGGLFPWPSAAGSLEILSASVNDIAAGTGARTVLVAGLDSTYKEISETVTLNGTLAVALVRQYLRINSIIVTSAGSGGNNAGLLTLRDAGGGTTRHLVSAGFGITRSSSYTVPAGHTLLVQALVFCTNRTAGLVKYATVALYRKSLAGVYILPLELAAGGETYTHPSFGLGIPLAEKFDFVLRCHAVSANDTDLTAGFIGVLKRNTGA